MRGILMIEPLYHQTVACNKTQTRRAGAALDEVNDFQIQMDGKQRNPDQCKLLNTELNGEKQPAIAMFAIPWRTAPIPIKSLYKIGEVLYLKEPIMMQGKRALVDKTTGKYVYRFDYPNISTDVNADESGIPVKWSNKLFMKANYARAFVRITGIRCERLLDISEHDAIAEGIEHDTAFGQDGQWKNYLYPQSGVFTTDKEGKVIFNQQKRARWKLTSAEKTPKESFISLFKFANKVKDVPNLWVFVYDFEYLKDYQPCKEK